MLRLSVIIPVYNDAARLARCLDALAAQTLPRDEWEVIVCDNGSNSAPHDVVARLPNARLVEERSPGSYAARNAGIVEARAKTLAFTDSDCVPNPTWLENGLSAIDESDASMIGGRVELFFRHANRPNLIERHDAHIAGFPQKELIEFESYAVTANLFVNRAVFEEAGNFDTTQFSGGDREFGQRATAAGYHIEYAHDVVVAHPARASLKALQTRTRRVYAAKLRRMLAGGYPQQAVLRDAVVNLAPPLRVFNALAKRDDMDPPTALGIAGVVWFTKLIKSAERIRVLAGGSSERR